MPDRPEDIAAAIERLARLMRADEHGGGLNPAQWEALRYLARANRFSNSPGALARYLGATKGTVSQTVKSLVRKGHVTSAAREGERRSLALELTPRGNEALLGDPWLRLRKGAAELGGKTRKRLDKGLKTMLDAERARGDHPGFGSCEDCRYFRERGPDDGPHCMRFETPLKAEETSGICVEQVA